MANLKVPEVAKALRTSNSWVYGKIKSGDIVAYRLPGGRLLRVPYTELAKFQPHPKPDEAPNAQSCAG